MKIDDQDATLRQNMYTVSPGVLIINAGTFAKAIQTVSVDEFVDQLTTSYPEDLKELEAWLEGTIDATC